MPEAYERGAIVLVQPGAAARPSGGERMSRRGLLDRLRQLGWPDVVVASAGELPALLADAGIGALVVDARGGPEAWDEVRSALLAPPGPVADDVPLLLVADDAAWPRVLDVLHRGLGDGLRLPCADAELHARVRGVAGLRAGREAERDRLARAIHDDSLQVLASVTMRLQLLRRRLGDEDVAALDEVVTDLGEAVEGLRTLEIERRVAPVEAGRWVRGAGADDVRAAAGPSVWASPELLSHLGHDLRSPLNAVLGFAQLLELGELDDDQADAVRQIIRAGTRLLELVNEVVDLSRIEAGHLDLSLEPVDAVEVVREAVELTRPTSVEASVELAGPDVGGEVPVLADRQRLLQVLLILLANGVRHSRSGGHVRVEVVPSGDLVRVAVRDDGVGIAPEDLPKVFVPFDRPSEPTGAGLGLAIAKGLLARMGSRIDVDSVPGEGSRFWFELRAASSEGQIDAAASGEAEPFEVLYIEDNPASMRLVERILAHRPGVTMISAMRGRLGVQLAAQRQPGLVLVDLHLPDMSGADVVQALTSDPLTRHIPVVVLTADAVRPSGDEGGLEGVRAHLTKPFEIDVLLDLVDTVRRERDDDAGTVGGSHGTSTMSQTESPELRP